MPAPVRVVVQHDPNLFAILGIEEDANCPREISVEGHTFYRAASTPRWVLYKPALRGWGQTTGGMPDVRQR